MNVDTRTETRKCSLTVLGWQSSKKQIYIMIIIIYIYIYFPNLSNIDKQENEVKTKGYDCCFWFLLELFEVAAIHPRVIMGCCAVIAIGLRTAMLISMIFLGTHYIYNVCYASTE